MKILPKIFLLYSILFSFFILFSAVLAASSSGGLIVSFLFIPVPVLLIYTLLTNKRNKTGINSEPNMPSFTLKNITYILIFFSIIFVVGAANVIGNFGKVESEIAETVQKSDNPIIFQNNPSMKVVLESKNTVISVYNEATDSAEIIKRIKNGVTLDVYDYNENWYRVNIEGSDGYINKQAARPIK
jgi:hypothetical protein